MTDEQLIIEFQKLEDSFNQAMISNNLGEISKCISAVTRHIKIQNLP
jgi:hypothetical protein